MVSSGRPSAPDCIRLRGVRQNNLKGFDLDIPLGRYVVVTGLSGAGKSSLVFDTLHAEGQRRYVETFSAYTRQFLDLLDKPAVDTIENIRPSIAIEQTNTVKTSRSTVGTMTELTDYAKVWFSHVAKCYDPDTGLEVVDDTPATIWNKATVAHPDTQVVVAFKVTRPGKLKWSEILKNLRGQAYVRVLVPDVPTPDLTAHRIDELEAKLSLLDDVDHLFVAQDRVTLRDADRGRFLEAAESALHFGQGELHLFKSASSGPSFVAAGHYSRGLHAPGSGRSFRAASPALFSFNSPLGACPHCRGFGRVIEIDYRLAIPDHTKSIDDGAIKCWEGQVYGESKKDLLKFTRKLKIPTNIPFAQMKPEHRNFVINGSPGYGEDGVEWPKAWYGLKGFFGWLEKNTYKMHVRVFLSRFRAYNPCPHCGGTRLQPEALCWKWEGQTLPELYTTPVSDLLQRLHANTPAAGDRQSELAFNAMVTRLRYLEQVGLGYLTLDRSSKTLSGGEVQRVNLTSCLGTSLVDTLFVLDEPSVGLHPRDIDRLIGIIRTLTDAGNTVVVVEHDEAMIRAADHLIEIGPEPGSRGGHVVFEGNLPAMLESEASITGRYLSGRATISAPASRRTVSAQTPRLTFEGVTKHNLRDVTLAVPLQRLVCLSGVSGSGKSTLLNHAIYQGLLTHRFQQTEDVAAINAIHGDDGSEIVLVDQSPLSRTPRSNPALYCEAWDGIRNLFAREPAATAAGFTASSFSFNAGDGRCDHCQGLGYERVEMQFLSDVFVPCPMCEGRRFKPEVLAIKWNGRSVAELLQTSISDALPLFAEQDAIASRLRSLDTVGLGYLTLGQPLNTLSGGEAQRLKLVKYLGAMGESTADESALLLLDEPTTGLHRHDVGRLLAVLQALVDRGHSVIVIEHNLDVLKAADWLIEIGPEAGADGGRIIAEAPPETIAALTGRAATATSPYLREALDPTCHLIGDKMPLLAAESAVAMPVRASGLSIVGARENNLKNLSLNLPHNELIVVTGVSGSGKSTLAFDIVFAEGQRRFMESMSAYARQFVEQLPRPAIDHLGGIPPTVAIEQRITRGSRKSTVATITEVAQYLRLLYARMGVQHHPDSDRPVEPLSPAQLRQLLTRVLRSPQARRAKHLYLCAPLIRGRKGHHEPIAKWIERHGFELMRADGRVFPVDAFTKLDRYKEHDVEVVVADLKTLAATELGTALQEALRLGKGGCFLINPAGEVLSWFSTTRTDLESGESFPELDPKHFSHNSPRGWCPACRGHGRIFGWMAAKNDKDDLPPEIADLSAGLSEKSDASSTPCPQCLGDRLNRVSRAVKLPLKGRQPPISLPDLLRGTAEAVLKNLRNLKSDTRSKIILRDILPQIEERLKFLDHVGLGYLALERPTATLSGGEAQRIRLAAQLGTNLAGVLYVLDEPSIGLHARDNDRLIATLESLRDKGNSLLVVEHDDELMLHADRIVDLGPGAGTHGGELLAAGTPAEIQANAQSLTGLFLAKGIAHPIKGAYRSLPAPRGPGRATDWLKLSKVSFRNLQGFDLNLPLGRLVMAVGPSGAGKSTLFRDVLRPAVSAAIKAKKTRLTGATLVKMGAFDDVEEAMEGAPFGELSGALPFKTVIEVDQSPIGKTPRSTPATYLGIFDLIRQFFASLPESKIRGYTASRFSFNTAGGRCETCAGGGRIKLEMAFMPDTFLPCDDCGGSRYGPELDDVTWNDRTIGDVLRLTFEEAAAFFSFHSQLGAICQLMVDCGLGYLTLGQSSPSLSGGEAQRLKLIAELSRGLASYTERSRGQQPHNLYLLEEPTIGLHLSDCEKLIHLLHSLVDQGHSVVVIEHHLDLIAEADYVIELGPTGGPDGGRLLYQGNLAGLMKRARSVTAPYLREKIDRA
ncbi:excinuclease ABC subunit UvrA [Synoicihabitans lomoniglobus]|uniref:UvrABC system protein A n=1 Tax=Synoicihabitans lomoniglobus TaxID=2909285 RepID=A0AAF0CQN3_9BACT|nr:excinuclease ABC subunit UvrA [Opitutaceae bacterium LMO-M01]WED66290.1 excinuclease ABC subunit UvrA [Opitutaceae bacterium LMO-M01]